MENLDLNLSAKNSNDVIREAAAFFADQGYSVLNQGFAEVVSSDRLSEEFISALTEGCTANDAAVIGQLCQNSRQSILTESLGGIMPISSLSMPVIRKLWPRVAMKEAIKTIPATAPIFTVAYMKPYLTNGADRIDLPRGAFGAGGYQSALDTLKVPASKSSIYAGAAFVEATLCDGELDTKLEIVSVGGVACGATLGLGKEIIADVKAAKKLAADSNSVAVGGTNYVKTYATGEGATADVTVIVRPVPHTGKVKVAVLGLGSDKTDIVLAARETSEWNKKGWDVNFDLGREEIRIGTGEHLNCPLSVEQVQDMKALYNIDAASEAADTMTEVFAQRLDHEIIDFLVKCYLNRPSHAEWQGLGNYTSHLYRFNVAPAAGFAGSPKAWREELKPVIDFAATALMSETYFQSGTFVICGHPHDTALLANVDWQYKGGTGGNVDGVAITYNVGVFQSGSYVYKVVSSMNMQPGSLMLHFIPSGDKQLTVAYYPYSFVMEKGTGYRSPNHANVPSIMMTKRHTFFEYTPTLAMIAIEGNDGQGQFNRGDLFRNNFTGDEVAAPSKTWGAGVKA